MSDTSKWSTGSAPGNSDTARIDKGKVTIHGNVSLGLLELSSDPLHGSTGTMDGTGTLTLGLARSIGTSKWDAGEMSFSNGGGVTVAGGAALEIGTNNDHKLKSTVLRNQGTIDWTGGALRTGNGSTIENTTGATFDIKSDASLLHSEGGARAVFSNAGTVKKSSGSGTTTVEATFNNAGGLELAAGKVRLAGGGTSTGSVAIGSASTLEIATTDYTFSGTLTGGGSLEIIGANTTFEGLGGNGHLKVNGGTARFSGNQSTTASLTLASGKIEGSSSADVGSLAWTAGEITSATVHATSATIGTGGSKKLVGSATLHFTGATTWSADDITTGGGAKLTNSGTFTAAADGKVAHDALAGTRATFQNDGTFTKSSGAGGSAKTEVQATFTNQGQVNADAGTLALTGGGNSTGTLAVASGARLELGSGFALAGGTLTGAGAAAFTGNGAWTGGNMTGAGSTHVEAATELTISGSSDKKLYHGSQSSGGRTLDNAGTITWAAGAGNLLLGDGARLSNRANSTLRIQNDSTLGHAGFGGTGTLVNDGNISKTAATGTTTIAGVDVTNNGVVDTQTGTIAFAATLTNQGELRAGAGAANTFSGTQVFNHGTRFTGSGRNKVTSGTTTFNGTITSQNLELAGGTAAGAATFSGNTTWSGGDLTGSGAFAFQGGTLAITGSDQKRLFHGSQSSGGKVLRVSGSGTWDGSGDIRGGDGAGIEVQAGSSLEIRTDASYGHIGFGNAPTLVNSGTLRKTTTTGTTTISEVAVTNTGNVHVDSGTLQVSGGGGSFNNHGTLEVATGAHFSTNASGTSSGIFKNANASTLRFTGGRQTLNAGATFLGAGAEIAGATFNVAGATSVGANGQSGRLRLSSGAIVGSGALTIDSLGSLEWDGGDMTGSGITSVLGGGQVVLRGNDEKRLFHGNASNGGRMLDNSGLIAVEGGAGLKIGDGAGILNRAGATFDLRNDIGLAHAGFGNAGTFTNSGAFNKSAGTGTSRVSGVHFTNHANVWAKTGTLAFEDAVTNYGSFQASPGAAIHFNGPAHRVFGAGSTFHGGGAHVIGAGTNEFKGNFSAHNLTFAGGTLTGPATLEGTMTWTAGDWISGSTFTVASSGVLTLDGPATKRLFHGSASSGGRSLINEGVVIWQGSGALHLGDGSQLVNSETGTLSVRNNATLGHAGFGNQGTVVNHGTLIKHDSSRTTTIAQPYTQTATGRILVNSGTLAFTSSFTNQGGAILLAAGSTLSSTSTIDLGGGSLFGGGSLVAPRVIAGGLIAPGSSPGTLNISGELTLLATSALLIELGGETQGTSYDFVTVGGPAQLAGNLVVTFTNGYQPNAQTAGTFTVLTSGGHLTGAFFNVASGQRVFTADGFGSFQVNYGLGSTFAANSVVLSNFVAVPEPSTWMMLGVGASLVLWQVRRRRR